MMTSLIAHIGSEATSDGDTTTDASLPTTDAEAADSSEGDRIDDPGGGPEAGAVDPVADEPGEGSDTEQESEPAEEGGTDDAARDLPLDVTFEILKNRRRRLVLEYLDDSTGTTPIGELAEHIAAIENGIDVRQLDSQQRKRVYIGLYQCHLPKMDDAGVVEFEQNRGQVELAENAEPLYEYLEADDEAETEGERPVHRRYALLTVLFTASFVAAQLANVQLLANALVGGFFLAALALVYVESESLPT